MSAEEFQLASTVQLAVAKALDRIADALFRQAKASERSVKLQEELIENQRKQAVTTALLEEALKSRLPQ